MKRLVVASIATFTACSYGYVAPIITMPLAPQMAGATRCSDNNLPVILIQVGITSDQREAAIVHEMVHVRQMNAHIGGCKGAFKHALTNKAFRVSQEKEAYCEEARWAWKRQGHDLKLLNTAIHELFKRIYDTTGVTCSLPP